MMPGRLCNAARETVQCCRGDIAILPGRPCNAAVEIVECCGGYCAMLPWRLCNDAGQTEIQLGRLFNAAARMCNASGWTLQCCQTDRARLPGRLQCCQGDCAVSNVIVQTAMLPGRRYSIQCHSLWT